MRNPIIWLTDRAVSRRGRWIVLALWLAAAVALSLLAPNLNKLYDNNATAAIGDQESVRAAALVQQAFPNQTGVPAIIVISDPQGLSPADLATARTISDCLAAAAAQAPGGQCLTARLTAKQLATCFPNGALPPLQSVLTSFTVPQAAAQLISADNTTMTEIATIGGSASDPAFSTCDVQAISTYTRQFDVAPLAVKVSGPAGVIADAVAVFASTDLPLLLGTVLLVLVLLVVIYRSPVLALVPLVAVGWALTIVNALIAFAAQAHVFAVSQQATSIMTVLLFGAGTDYTIFIAARYREELRQTADRRLALRDAARGVGEAITSSAGTVILGLLTLVLTTLGLYQALGPVLAIAVAVMLLAGLTLVPALLSVLGRVAFWPFVPRYDPAAVAREQAAKPRGFWARLAAFVGRRPAAAVAGSALLLAVLALGNLGVPEVFNFLTGFRSPTDSAAGYKLLAAHFPPGTLAPFTVVIHAPGTDLYRHLAALDSVDQAVAGVSNVAGVTGPTRPAGTPLPITPAVLQADFAALPNSLKDALRNGTFSASSVPTGPGVPAIDPTVIGDYAATVTTISADGHTALLRVTLADDPYSVPALDTMAPVRAAARQALAASDLAGAASAQLTGVTPQLADTRAVSDHDKLIVVPLALALTAIILGVLLRSLVAPLYLLAAITLNYFAALGASAFLFTRIQGDDGLAYATPLYTFIFLVALGADYTIFLMSRVREEAGRRGLRAGTQVALSQTGGVITSAGVILAGTFLVLTTLPLRDLYQFGVAVALGILLDTFVVRGLLVPGIVLLLGRWNWWPGRVAEPQSSDAMPAPPVRASAPTA